MKKLFCLVILFTFPFLLKAQFISQYPDIPRIDVHAHHSGKLAENYLILRDAVKQSCNADIAMWVNLNKNNVEELLEKTGGRMYNCFTTSQPAAKGIEYHKIMDIQKLKAEGYIGYKIWSGPNHRQKTDVLNSDNKTESEIKYPYIDDPHFYEAFDNLEKQGVLLASLHIADPNGSFDFRTNWLKDPVDYWRQITAFEHVMNRNPNLNVVAAHAVWLMTQDAQIDFLRYLLSTYQNLNIDISATLQYMNLASYDNIRDFFIEYQDRIMWGSDFLRIPNKDESFTWVRDLMINWFRFLETDDVFGEEFSHNKKPVKGLNLPEDVLEKIYYKNALRIYPKLKEGFLKLSYTIK